MNFLNEIVHQYPDAISFAPGRPREDDFDPALIGSYLDAYIEYLSDTQGWSPRHIAANLFQYGRTNGHIHQLIARTVANDEGIGVVPEAVVVTVGAQEGMLLVLRTLFREANDVLLVTDPCYVGITGAARLLDIEVVPITEGPDGISAAIVAEAVAALRIRGKRPRALYLVPDFSNPSGATIPAGRRRELLAVASQTDLLLLEDNPYGFFRSFGTWCPTLKSIDTERRVIYLGSFSKTCFPGARVGYVLADQSVLDRDGRRTLLADELSKVKSMTTVNTPALSQAVIGGMLIAHGCRLRPVNSTSIAHYRANLEALTTELETQFPRAERKRLGISWNCPDGGFFLVLTVPFTADDAALEYAARNHGVLWTPMRYFHAGDAGNNQLRLSYSTLSPDRIKTGVARLSNFIESQIAAGPSENPAVSE
ncbi:PLP-dependent aminotransferase family protein [Nocardia sp. NPDC101769]|uniref:aminotransferase-like domain-containing protein n=1 Tax=Nocardia sp. NPDC101769 TaxID=3364333 RepID=UPI00382BB4FD